MRIATIQGSPRKRGNTATLLSLFERSVAPHHQIDRIDVVDYNVNGCLGCNNCQGVYDQCGCAQSDDAEGLLERLMAADLIVYASPVYCWGFTAQLKALIDRHYCLVKWENGEIAQALLKGKQAALLLTCGGGEEDNADLVSMAHRRQMDYVGCENLGEYVVADCSTPDRLGVRGEAVVAALASRVAAIVIRHPSDVTRRGHP